MGNAIIKSEFGETVLDEQQELVIQVQEKLTAMTGNAVVAMDIAARHERAVISALQAAKLKPRDQQHLYSIALRQFLVDPMPGDTET